MFEKAIRVMIASRASGRYNPPNNVLFANRTTNEHAMDTTAASPTPPATPEKKPLFETVVNSKPV